MSTPSSQVVQSCSLIRTSVSQDAVGDFVAELNRKSFVYLLFFQQQRSDVSPGCLSSYCEQQMVFMSHKSAPAKYWTGSELQSLRVRTSRMRTGLVVLFIPHCLKHLDSAVFSYHRECLFSVLAKPLCGFIYCYLRSISLAAIQALRLLEINYGLVLTKTGMK